MLFPAGEVCLTVLVDHANEQIALCLVALLKRDAVWHGERLQQVGAWQIAAAKLLFGSLMQEACRGDAAFCAIACGDGFLRFLVSLL